MTPQEGIFKESSNYLSFFIIFLYEKRTVNQHAIKFNKILEIEKRYRLISEPLKIKHSVLYSILCFIEI